MNRTGSACSGYGGLDEAVLAVFGGSVTWFVEFAPAPSRLLAYRWPTVPNLHDLTAVDWSQVDPVDVFCGGYSCQPFSLAGRRKGADDERHVWPFLARGEADPVTGKIERPGALAVLRPRFAVFENVSGHLTLGFDRVLADLHELGYDAWWTLWNASDEGAPHRRRRLFVLAVRRDVSVATPRGAALVARCSPDGLWLGPDDGLFGAVPFADKPPSTGVQIGGDLFALPAPADVKAPALLGTPRCADGMEHPLRSEVGNPRGRLEDQIAKLIPTPLASDAGPRGGTTGFGLRDWSRGLAGREVPDRLLPTPIARDDKGAGYGDAPGRPLSEAVHALLPTPTATPYGNNQSDSSGAAVRPSLDSLAPTLLPTPRASDGVKGGPNQRGSSGDLMLPSAAVQAQKGWGAYGAAIKRWERVLGRAAPAPTMTGKRGGQQLSPAFVEWMMGLSEGHVTDVPGLSRAEQLKLLGNGVCPPQAEAALRWLAVTAGVSSVQTAA